ncbi:MAG: STAS domain-containing protein [Anaerolineales bacterium]|nr:STAS domain-containing protein [Anaerolineales bacterium]WKZ40859.1 MAG: STAS domain-containing protein [Anaerolineales bacterium]
MDTALRIDKEQVQGNVPVTVFHLHGWLDAQGESALLASARDAYDEGARFLLLDLAGVDTLTSAGMRAMQKVYKIFNSEGSDANSMRVKLCNAPPQVYHVLGITGFLQNIPNYETREAAISSFKE